MIIRLLILFLLSIFYITSNGQQYSSIIKSDTTIWYFAHQQLAGKFVDTIFVGEKQNDWFDLYYKGQFFNSEKTDIGKIKISKNNDKIWYIAPDDTTQKLIFDLTLKQGDTFSISLTYNQLIVDTILIKNGRKNIIFNYNTHWNEKVKFIEGVGPNISLICSEYYFLQPFVICQFERNENIYSTDNKNFINCDINTLNVKCLNRQNYQIYPNPFHNNLQINLNNTNDFHIIQIIDLYGKIQIEKKVCTNFCYLSTKNLNRGIYFLKINSNNKCLTQKIIKQ